MQIKKILCPVDFSEFSVRAYRHALSLAAHYDAAVLAMHVVELWKYPYAEYAASSGDYANFRRALDKGGKELLKEFVKKYPHDKIKPELAICEGRAPDSILAFAREQKVDGIVMGTHGRRGFDRLMLGSTTDRVMREASCPIIAVCKPTHESIAHVGEHPVHHLHRVLLCTDFSEHAERALEWAISVTEEYDAELTMLHIVEGAQSRQGQAMATAEKQLSTLIPAEKRNTLKVQTAVRMGKPYQCIIDYAREASTDLIAMGARGAGALDRAIFGSTTYRVIQLGPCPVLSVHV